MMRDIDLRTWWTIPKFTYIDDSNHTQHRLRIDLETQAVL